MNKTAKVVFSIIGIVAVAAVAYMGILLYENNKEYKPAGYDYPPISMVSYELFIPSEYEVVTFNDYTYARRNVYLDLTITNNSTKTIKELYIRGEALCVGLREDNTGNGSGGTCVYSMVLDDTIKEIKGKETVTLRVELGQIPIDSVKIHTVRVDMLAVTYIKFAGFGGEWGDMYAHDWNTQAPQFEIEISDYPEIISLDPPKDIPHI